MGVAITTPFPVQFQSSKEARSVLVQIAGALAVAEEVSKISEVLFTVIHELVSHIMIMLAILLLHVQELA